MKQETFRVKEFIDPKAWPMTAFLSAVALFSVGVLPPELQKELATLEAKIAKIEQRIGTEKPEVVDQNLREARLWVEEFTIGAELLETDPIAKRLNASFQRIREKSTHRPAAAKPAPKMPTAPKVEVKPAVDMAALSFKRDVAPILSNACLRCHSATRKSGDFDASAFDGLVAMLEPGSPDRSRLLDLVTGKANPRMPLGQPGGLRRDWIEILTEWIRQGAKFDGPSKSAAITSYLIDFETQQRQAIEKLGDAELDRLRESNAEKMVARLGLKTPPVKRLTANFRIYATLSAEDTEYAAAVAEAVLEDLNAKFNRKFSKRFRGRYTLLVFATRADYLSLAQAIDKIDPSESDFGHVRIKPGDPYIAMAGQHRGLEIDGLVAHQVTSAFLASMGAGKAPPWASYGYARHIALQFDRKSLAIKQELAKGAALLRSGATLDKVFSEQAPWVELAPLSSSLIQYLAKAERKRYIDFVAALVDTGDGTAAVSDALGSSVPQLQAAWIDSLRK